MELKNLSTELNRYDNFLVRFLSVNLFASGAKLREALVKEFTIHNDNARQIVSRAAKNKIIKSSKPFTFGKNQFIYLLVDQYLSAQFIMRVCLHSRPPLYRLLKSMESNGDIISYYDAMKITASPTEPSSTKVQTLDDMIKVLKKMDIVYEKRDDNGVKYILFFDGGFPGVDKIDPLIENQMMAECYSRMVIDASLIPDIMRWLGKSNLIDNSRKIYRNKKTPEIGAVHNKLWWDAFSYTKATGINAIAGAKANELEKQTLVVLDVVLASVYTQEHLDGLLSRVQINLNSVTTGQRKVLPIIFYRECEPIVLGRISKLGFIAFDIGSVFGNKIYEVVQELKEINELLAVSDSVESTVKSILTTIKRAGQDDALKDLKGTLFGCLMYPILKSLFPEASIERGKILAVKGEKNENGKYQTEKYEYDYIINSSSPREIVFVELKGYMSNVTISLGDIDKKSSLRWFFERTLPFAAKQYAHDVRDGKRIRAIFITTAKFNEDGESYIKGQNSGRYKSAVAYTGYERFDLIKMLDGRDFKEEIKIIEKFYTVEENKTNKRNQVETNE